MGCNCKKTAANAGKYSDDGSGVEIVRGLKKIPVFLLRALLVILASGLIIVILPFFLLWIMFRMIIGKEIKVNLSKILKFNGERK